MNMDNSVVDLKHFSLFKNLNDDELHFVAQYIVYHTYKNGDIIINEGDYGDDIYFLLEGVAEAFYIDNGKAIILQQLAKGDYFGEVALLTKGFRTCFVRAKADCRLMSLSSDNFYKILHNHPSISYALNIILSERLTNTLGQRKNENTIILLYYSEDAIYKYTQFIDYFKKITPKNYVILTNNDEQSFITVNSKMINGYILIRITKPLSEVLLKKSKYIVNFDEQKENQIYIGKQTTQWKVEHYVRMITNKTVGLALSSGGVPGAAHLTVLKTLQKNNIPVDYIAGASAGAIYGSCYAFGITIDNVIIRMLEEYNMARWKTALLNLSFNFTGVLRRKYLQQLIASIIGNRQLEDTLIPMAVVASDLYSGQTVVIEQGDAVEAITASCSAPLIVEPTKTATQLLVDGVVTAPLPVEVLIDKNIDIKIAVVVPQLDLATSIKEKSKILAIYLRSRSLMTNIIMNHSMTLADVIIKPKVEGINSLEYKSVENALSAGEEAANEALESIRNILYK